MAFGSSLAFDRSRAEAKDYPPALIPKRAIRLSKREREVFAQGILGKSMRDTAAALGLRESTLKVYRCRIAGKIGIGQKEWAASGIAVMLADFCRQYSGEMSCGAMQALQTIIGTLRQDETQRWLD